MIKYFIFTRIYIRAAVPFCCVIHPEKINNYLITKFAVKQLKKETLNFNHYKKRDLVGLVA